MQDPVQDPTPGPTPGPTQGPTPRRLALYLPTWATDRVRRSRAAAGGDDGARRERGGGAASGAARPEAILVVGDARGRRVVTARCARAAAAGVAVGLDAAEARSLLAAHDLVEAVADPAADLEALRRLATWALQFAPHVALDPPDGLALDVTGCAPLFGDEATLATRMRLGCTRRGVAARVAVASTAGCAWARARFGGGRAVDLVPPGAEAEALAPLPVAALQLPDDALVRLEEVGVERVGALLRLSRRELATRFPGTVLPRLDAALGREGGTAATAPAAHRAPPRFEVEVAFPGPVRALDAVRRATRTLLEALVARLEAEGLGALAVEVVLHRADAPPERRARALSRRTVDARHLATLLDPALETANLGWGVDRIVVAAPRTGPRRPGPARALVPGAPPAAAGAEPERAVADLLDALAGRLGPARLTRLEGIAAHVPEAAFRHVPVLPADDGPARASRPRTGSWPERGPHAAEDVVEVGPAERPAWLLAPPEPAEATTDARGAPTTVTWRATTHVVAAATAPERLAPRWWEAAGGDGPFPAGARAYRVVTTTTGRRLWVFRDDATGRWHVHGAWA